MRRVLPEFGALSHPNHPHEPLCWRARTFKPYKPGLGHPIVSTCSIHYCFNNLLEDVHLRPLTTTITNSGRETHPHPFDLFLCCFDGTNLAWLFQQEPGKEQTRPGVGAGGPLLASGSAMSPAGPRRLRGRMGLWRRFSSSSMALATWHRELRECLRPNMEWVRYFKTKMKMRI